MKKTILLFTLFLSTISYAQDIIYVDTDANGTGDGTSWSNAFPYIQSAFSSASIGSEIWIADGKYGVHPASIISRNLTFNWTVDSVKVLGGFDGTETIADQRNPSANITILSGDLYNDGDATNNMYTTLSGPRGTLSTPIDYSYIDGITVQGGYADNPSGKGYNGGKWGGGFFLQNYVSKIVFNNCTFKDNHAQGGAAMAFEPISSDAEVIISNCKFENNKGDYGNCITTIVHDASLDLEVKNCLFTRTYPTHFFQQT